MKLQTVLLNGEHTLLRAFLRAWLSRFNHLRVVAEAGDSRQAIELVRKYRPSLVLMDFDTFPGASAELLIKIRTAYPKTKVIVYFAYTNDDLAIKLIRAGAAGFVLKSAGSQDMEKAIKTVMDGGVYLSADFLKSLGTAALHPGKALNRSQTVLLKLIALGLPMRAIALQLKLGAKALEARKASLMYQLGVKNTAGLMGYAGI